MADVDHGAFIHQRKRRYMAQTLEEFESKVEGHVPKNVADDFKALVRRKMNALAVDATDILELDRSGQVQNGVAQDMRDRLYPDTRQPATSGGSAG